MGSDGHLAQVGFLFLVIAFGPFAEETWFRGIGQSLLVKAAPRVPWLAILVTAAVFGLMHPYTLVGQTAVMAGGVVFGACRQYLHTIWPAVLAHSTYNILTTVAVVSPSWILDSGWTLVVPAGAVMLVGVRLMKGRRTRRRIGDVPN